MRDGEPTEGKISNMRTARHRLLSALSGCFLLVVALWQSYLQSFGFYKEHYVWPREKCGVVTPLRWQDILFLIVFWPLAVGLFYFSYRLLRNAFCDDPAKTND